VSDGGALVFGDGDGAKSENWKPKSLGKSLKIRE